MRASTSCYASAWIRVSVPCPIQDWLPVHRHSHCRRRRLCRQLYRQWHLRVQGQCGGHCGGRGLRQPGQPAARHIRPDSHPRGDTGRHGEAELRNKIKVISFNLSFFNETIYHSVCYTMTDILKEWQIKEKQNRRVLFPNGKPSVSSRETIGFLRRNHWFPISISQANGIS